MVPPDEAAGEVWQIVAEKTAYALNQGLKVCLCVGETLQERERNETGAVVSRQTAAVAGTDWTPHLHPGFYNFFSIEMDSNSKHGR